MTALAQAEYDDYCPSCGSWDNTIVPALGWCVECVARYHQGKVCERCQNTFQGEQRYCASCKRALWIERNIDALEEQLALGLSMTAAIAVVSENNRSICRVCGTPIKGGRNGTFFCGKTNLCRAVQRKFKAIRGKRTKEEAAQEALRHFGVRDQRGQ